jgi:ribonucleotide reductase alpha subunit
LHAAAGQVARNLNRIIDINTYPTSETGASNAALRPIGIGVQGLGDLYCMLHIPYDDPRAVALDAEVMETIYHGAITASVELAERDGPYSRFEGSPASLGCLQFDLWGITPSSGRWDWDALKARVKKSGLRNSLLTALMPTATTSQILGNCESFEPFQANVFKRSTMAGEFVVVNRHLMNDMMALGLWTEDLRRQLLSRDGSVQGLAQVPDELKRVYRTVWEVPQRSVIDHAVARGPYVDQSQSMNLYMAAPSFQKLSSALVYAWRCGLKTGVYYLRSMAAVEAIKYGLLPASVPSHAHAPSPATLARVPGQPGGDAEAQQQPKACPMRRAGDEECVMCSA